MISSFVNGKNVFNTVNAVLADIFVTSTLHSKNLSIENIIWV